MNASSCPRSKLFHLFVDYFLHARRSVIYWTLEVIDSLSTSDDDTSLGCNWLPSSGGVTLSFGNVTWFVMHGFLDHLWCHSWSSHRWLERAKQLCISTIVVETFYEYIMGSNRSYSYFGGTMPLLLIVMASFILSLNRHSCVSTLVTPLDFLVYLCDEITIGHQETRQLLAQ